MTTNHNIADIVFFACGGTIDKIYYDAKSSYSVGDPSVDEIIVRARAQLPAAISLLKKDSLDMTDADRQLVADAVAGSSGKRIVISHGTDTMADTARAIAANPATADKTVVLVGAFKPAVFKGTDTDFNIGFALGAALLMPAGVYVAMNGTILPAATVRKNLAAGKFES